jgi:hypothetical protein
MSEKQRKNDYDTKGKRCLSGDCYSVFVFLLALFIWFIFEEKLIEIFDIFIRRLSSNMTLGIKSTIVFMIILLFPIYKIYKSIKNKYYVSLFNILLIGFFIYIYFEYRKMQSGNILIPNILLYITNTALNCKEDYFTISDIPLWLEYTDIAIIILSFFLIFTVIIYVCSFFKHKGEKNITPNLKLIPDTPIENSKEDKLDYKESVKELAGDLESIPQYSLAYSVGLIATWGAGKTSYLNLLANALNEDKFIVIRFNPRHSFRANNIQEDFFKEIFSVLKRYDSRFSSSFKNYLKAINVISENKITSFLLYLVHKSHEKNYEKGRVNEAISRINKKIVVIIDDFDRLLADEIVEVFKLIDGSASFKNFIFISAYDKGQINEIINKSYFNEDNYFSDKFFTLEIQLPLRPYERISNYLQEQLLHGLSVKAEESEFYKNFLTINSSLLRKYLTTLRDVKRFLNSFIIQYKQIEGEVEFKDYFLLHLMKFTNLNEYLALYRKENVSTNFTKSLNRYYLNDIVDEKVKTRNILEILFSETSEKTIRSINNELAFDIYFHESVCSGLTIKEMETIFDDTLDKVRLFIDNSNSDNKVKNLISFLESRNILAFNNKEQFERYIDLLLYINVKDYDTTIPYMTLLNLIDKAKGNEISIKYSYNDDDYKELITSKLKGVYPYYPYNITGGIIIALINKEFKEEIIFSKENMLQIAKGALDDLIQNDNQIKQQHISLLYSCVDKIDQTTRNVTLDKDACLKIRTLIEENPIGYFENFVRLGMYSSSPDFNSVACEPFWKQIFGNTEEFEEFLNKQDLSTILKNFWELYKNNGYNMISFEGQGNVQEKIDNDLKEEYKMLLELLKIEQNMKNSIDPKELSILLDRVDNEILLPISKRGEIRKDIVSKLKSL